MLLNRNVPSIELFLGQFIKIDGFFAGDQLSADGAHDGGFAAGHPTSRLGIRQIGPGHHRTIRERHRTGPIYLLKIHPRSTALERLGRIMTQEP